MNNAKRGSPVSHGLGTSVLENDPSGQRREPIPQATLETLARNFFKEASRYGFQQMDYVRFVNVLLDISIEAATRGRTHQSNETGHAVVGVDGEFDGDRLPITDSDISIRAFEPSEDLHLLEHWLSDKSGRYFLLSCSTARITDCEQLLASRDNHVGIIMQKDGVPIGAMAYLNHDRQQHKAELRKLIGVPSMRGKGMGKQATQLWIRYGTLGLGLQKIYLNTLDTNLRNIKLNEELGFKIEGILRNEILLDGRYRDVLRMGLWTSSHK